MKTHVLSIRPIYADLDAMDVVYYANYLRYFEQGRTELMREAGFPYALVEKAGMHCPVSEAGVRYRKPARYDQDLVLHTNLAWIKKVSLRFDYRLLCREDGTELVSGYSVHGCITHQGKVTPLPPELRQALAAYSL